MAEIIKIEGINYIESYKNLNNYAIWLNPVLLPDCLIYF